MLLISSLRLWLQYAKQIRCLFWRNWTNKRRSIVSTIIAFDTDADVLHYKWFFCQICIRTWGCIAHIQFNMSRATCLSQEKTNKLILETWRVKLSHSERFMAHHILKTITVICWHFLTFTQLPPVMVNLVNHKTTWWSKANLIAVKGTVV
jgi:hypothetical protein